MGSKATTAHISGQEGQSTSNAGCCGAVADGMRVPLKLFALQMSSRGVRTKVMDKAGTEVQGPLLLRDRVRGDAMCAHRADDACTRVAQVRGCRHCLCGSGKARPQRSARKQKPGCAHGDLSADGAAQPHSEKSNRVASATAVSTTQPRQAGSATLKTTKEGRESRGEQKGKEQNRGGGRLLLGWQKASAVAVYCMKSQAWER